MEAGAEFFLTQPVFSREQAQILRDMKAETGATILVGIMPLVSRRNALFMKNEMAGIEIPEMPQGRKARSAAYRSPEIYLSTLRILQMDITSRSHSTEYICWHISLTKM